MGFDVYRLSNITLIFPSQHHVHRAATRSGHHCCLQSPLPRAAGAVRDLELDRNPDMTMQQVKINAKQ
jgi:hypothetical protein